MPSARPGAEVTLDPSQVKQVVAGRAEQQEYDKVRPQYPDTAEGQWQLAEWCREHELPTQRKTHLQRVIELDTNHVEARRALGFTQNDGKWMTQEDAMIKQGYRLYKGSWKLPQQIELLENKRKQDLAEKDWFQKIKRGGVGSGPTRSTRPGRTSPALTIRWPSRCWRQG